ncbi:MAG: hypothetical protein CSA65_04730 [Proteobacteria bacterium]|nr:MAG: hypothetical protein CSA65_04730 [Pseudomonadota bacterium]
MIRALSHVVALLVALGCLGPIGVVDAAPGKTRVRVKLRKYPFLFQGPGLPYSGVTLKGGEPPPAPRPPKAGLQYITWPGFRTNVDAPSEVFMQLTGPVSYTIKQRGTRINITINKVQVYRRNTTRAVVTRHFPGPVTWFRLRRAGRNRYRLQIRLREAVTPTVQLKQQDKYHYLVVTFPSASSPKSPPPHSSRRRAQPGRPLSGPQNARQTTRMARLFGYEIGTAAQHPARS